MNSNTQINSQKINIGIILVFWLIFTFFIINTSNIWFWQYFEPLARYVSIFLIFAFPVLGIALIILAAKVQTTKAIKAFLILTGSSAIGIALFGVLHNLFYVFLIKFFANRFGNDFDEAVFFTLATVICPLALLVGIIGTIILIYRKRT